MKKSDRLKPGQRAEGEQREKRCRATAVQSGRLRLGASTRQDGVCENLDSGLARSRSCQVFPRIGIVAVATCKPFAGGLLHSRSVGLAAFAWGESFSPLPKWLKSQAAQVPKFHAKSPEAAMATSGK